MDTKNVPTINVEGTEESTSSTSLVYNRKEGKWQGNPILVVMVTITINTCQS